MGSNWIASGGHADQGQVQHLQRPHLEYGAEVFGIVHIERGLECEGGEEMQGCIEHGSLAQENTSRTK